MGKKIRIFIGTDYSEASASSEIYGLNLARVTDSIVFFLHVYRIPLSSTPAKLSDFAKTRSLFHKNELNLLEQHLDERLDAMGLLKEEIDCECIVSEGRAGKQIRKEAEKCDADFIFVGAHGSSGIKDVFFGSHTWDVIKKSSTPVFVIPNEAIFPGLKNIVFATECREGEIPVINYLVQFAVLFATAITILHITNYSLSKEFEEVLFHKYCDEIKRKISYSKLDMRLAHYEDIVTGLNDFCVRTNADLLVMSPEKSILWEKVFNPVTSVTRKMTFHLHTPLLSIPDHFNPEHRKFWQLFELDEEFKRDDL
jgi:nucleotide-binding universal stress UspA family protein